MILFVYRIISSKKNKRNIHMRLEEILSNKFIRITLMIFFLLFIYKILFAIGIFFAIDSTILSMYLTWITMLVIFASILPFQKSLFKVSKKIDPVAIPSPPV
jgi:hypothetical protein